MKKILIIGAGFGQLPAIRCAKKLGLETICIDRNPLAIGMKIADYSYVIDVKDYEGALEVARKHGVSGVMTMQSDLPVPTIGFINDRLELRGVSFQAAMNCSNKILTRNFLLQKNCEQPKFKITTNITQAIEAANILGYPCVVKAPDSSGSRGVTKVCKEEDILRAWDEGLKYTQEKRLLVEEYIEGLEFGAQTFSVDGKCDIVLLHNDTLSPSPYMIPIGHSFPFKYLSEGERDTAIYAIKLAVEALGIKDGPANVDLILDKNTNRIKIIEIGARIGATCLPELVTYYTGLDWVEATIRSAIGAPPSLDILEENPVAGVIVQSPKDGTLVNFSIPSDISPEIIEFEITADKGSVVNRLRKGTDRIGKVIAKGSSAYAAEENAVAFLEKLNFEIE